MTEPTPTAAEVDAKVMADLRKLLSLTENQEIVGFGDRGALVRTVDQRLSATIQWSALPASWWERVRQAIAVLPENQRNG